MSTWTSPPDSRAALDSRSIAPGGALVDMRDRFVAPALILLLLTGCASSPGVRASDEARARAAASRSAVNERVAHYAKVYGVPESLIHRSIQRESGYDPSQH